MELKPKNTEERKRGRAVAMIVLALLFAAGLVLILTSTSIGMQVADTAVRQNGGSMDTATYEFIMTSTAENYSIVGMILAVLSGFAFVLGGAGPMRKNKQ